MGKSKSTASLHSLNAERSTGFTLIGMLKNRTVETLNARLSKIIQRNPAAFKTITADNGTLFHGYARIEEAFGITCYFCTPYHSWECEINENTSGSIRQYLPKGQSKKTLTQARCYHIAQRLNTKARLN